MPQTIEMQELRISIQVPVAWLGEATRPELSKRAALGAVDAIEKFVNGEGRQMLPPGGVTE